MASSELCAVAQPVQGRLPDFFIVGHSKSGTTALYEMLRRHPQIYMPELKEPLFFAPDLYSRFQSPRSGPLPSKLDDYLVLFAASTAEQRVGEASSSYLWSQTAAENIAAAQPAARIIAILREPASFLRSFHLQLLQNHIETEQSFRAAIELVEPRRRGECVPQRSHRPQALLYTDHVRYVEQLRRFHAVFPPEQVLVLIYDDFRRDNEATVRTVLRFLEVDDKLSIAPVEVNPTIRVRSQQLDDLMRVASVGNGPVSRFFKASVKALTHRKLRRSLLRATRRRLVVDSPAPPEEALMLELRRRFKGEVVALSEYLGRDLVALWGYDGVA